jgi:hypothetical protein
MKTSALLQRFPAVIAFAALLAPAACNNSDSVTGPPAPSIVPPANLAGTWTGKYTTNDAIDCDPSHLLDASATLRQDGAHVSGTLVAPGYCGLNYQFDGEVRGNTVAGAISLGSFHGTASGVLSDGTLRMVPVNSYGWEMGTLTLRR